MVYDLSVATEGGYRTEVQMGLTVTRRVGETVLLEVAEGTTAQELWDALQGGISVRVVASQNTRAKLDFTVPQLLRISRVELVDEGADD